MPERPDEADHEDHGEGQDAPHGTPDRPPYGSHDLPPDEPVGAPGAPEGPAAAEAGPVGPPSTEDGEAGPLVEEVPLRQRVHLWSPIGADTSDVKRPDPRDVDLRTPVLLFLAPVALLVIGSIVARELVWDGFLDPYVWDYIVHDRGFNPYNTAMWAVLLGLLLFFSYRLVQKLGQPIDFLVIAATVPFMVGGAVVRVLEDTGYFGEPLRFFFITPIVYVLIFSVAVLWLVIGWVLRRQAENVAGHEAALRSLAGLFGFIWVMYFGWTLYGADEVVSHVASPWVLLFAFIVPLVYFWFHTRQTGSFSQVGVMATFGSAFMIFAVYMIVLWHTGANWEPVVDKPVPADPENRLWIYPLMVGIVGAFIAVLYYFAHAMAARTPNAFVFLLPVNLLVVFGQTWDALSTSLGVDFLGYAEKHVLPHVLIELLEGTGAPLLSTYAASFVMIPLKILVAVLVVWLVDVYSRQDMVKHPDLVGLVKLAIIMVGVVPGTRNMIRMAMGV